MTSTDFNADFKIKFRDFVLNDLEVASLIGDRFYGSYLATFYTDSTTFPLATFTFITGSLPNLNIIQQFPLVIDCFSNQHYDEAYTIDKAILDILGGTSGPVYINNNIIIRPVTSPQEKFDEGARIYSIERRYHVVYFP